MFLRLILTMLVSVSAVQILAGQRIGTPIGTVVERATVRYQGAAPPRGEDLAVPEAASEPGSNPGGGVGIRGPSLGSLYDPAEQKIRPIWGLPGAATLGEPLELGLQLVAAAVSPRQDYALVVAAGHPELALIRLDDGLPLKASIPLAEAGADRVVFSPSGGSAVLYDRDRARIRVLRGLPSQPEVGPEIDVSAPLGPVGTLAISDDGQAILVGVSEQVLLLSAEGGSRFVWPAGELSAIAFLHRSHDALVADRRMNTVYLLRDVTATMQTTVVATERDGVRGPVAVETSADNQRAFVASSEPGAVLVLDLSSGLTTTVSCGCSIAGMHRLSGNAVFRLSEPSESPLALFDGDAPEPRVVFLPATQLVAPVIRRNTEPARPPGRRK